MGPAQVGLAIQPTQKVRYVAQITGIVASSMVRPARELRCGPFSAGGRSSGPNSSARHSFYWLVLAAFPAVGERLLEREDFGYSAWAFLLSPRDGSRKQSPPTPADDAWHCSMLSKPQLVICPVTSLRQNSAALASGAIIAPKAIVASSSAAAGAVAAFKSSFIMFVLSGSPGAEITEIGAPQSSIKHQSILKYYNHMKDFRCLRWPRREKTRFARSCAKPSIPC